MDDTKETVFFQHNKADAQRLAETVAICTDLAHVQARWVPALRWGTKKLLG